MLLTTTSACLITALYFEARSETIMERIFITTVIMNRVKSDKFPNTVCDVVKQRNSAKLNDCQFSWYCDGLSETMHNDKMKDEITAEVTYMLAHQDDLPNITSTHFVSEPAKPYWTTHEYFKRDLKIGKFTFYTELRRY